MDLPTRCIAAQEMQDHAPDAEHSDASSRVHAMLPSPKRYRIVPNIARRRAPIWYCDWKSPWRSHTLPPNTSNIRAAQRRPRRRVPSRLLPQQSHRRICHQPDPTFDDARNHS